MAADKSLLECDLPYFNGSGFIITPQIAE